MRILHVIESLDERVGGPLRFAMDLSVLGSAHGMQSEIIGPGPTAMRDADLPSQCIHPLQVANPAPYRYVPELTPWLEANLKRFDGVVLHGMWLYPQWRAAKACVRERIGYVCCPHGMLAPWSILNAGRAKALKKALYWLLREQYIYKHARCVFYITKRERSEASKLPGIANKKSMVIPIPTAIDVSQVVRPNRDDLIPAPGVKLCLYLGRLHPKKNVPLLLRAWKKASPGPKWRLVIAGTSDPEHVRALRQLVAELSLADQVDFPGFVTGIDKRYLLQRASWFLLPSEYENFGVSVLEAIQQKCAVAISDQVYLGDYFSSPAEVLSLKEESWVEFMRTRMQDENWRASVAEKNRADTSNYIGPRTVESWIAALQDVFATKPKTRAAAS